MKHSLTPAWLRAGAFALIICSLSLGTKICCAMWAALTDEELVRSADLIVIGEWQESPSTKNSGPTAQTSSIVVIEVLKGNTAASVRIARPSDKALRSSSDLIFHTGDRGLWLLRQSPGNHDLFLIDHPQRFIPELGGEKRIRLLKRLISP